jgi:hypothetical protein
MIRTPKEDNLSRIKVFNISFISNIVQWAGNNVFPKLGELAMLTL